MRPARRHHSIHQTQKRSVKVRPTFATARKALEAGTITCERVTEGFVDAVEKGKRLNAFLSVFRERPLAGVADLGVLCGAGAKGLPVGLRRVGKQFAEATILRMADAFERVALPSATS